MSTNPELMEVDVESTNQNDNRPPGPSEGGGVSGAGMSSANASISTASASSVMASTTTVPSVTVSLHPLVVMNISEHWTRIRAQEGCKQQGKKRTNKSHICIISPFVNFSNWGTYWQTNGT